ncbi:MAG: glycosyltransferase family 39 protein [Verrucomicrobia bacterium]|nr:MAG: glycosyltransferase family 39 protein [Verrucomicrobiota bacterium]
MPIAAVEPTPQRLSSERALIIWFSAAALLIHLLTNRGYGYFRDELYYMACGQHLDFGYVDLPPLSALLIRLSRVLFGDSLFAIRLLPALAGAGTVALTGVITRELGGRRWAVALGCTASLFAVVFLANGNFFSMNAFEPLFWMGCIYLLVRIINGGSPHLWLLFGVLAGLGVENKHSTVFFGAGILVALLLTPERRHFSKKWIWLGGLIAFAIALPNIFWQVRHHWATYELLSNIAHSHKNVVLTPAQFIAPQILIMNPATLPLWLGGLIWLFASHDGRRYCALAIAYLVTLAEFIVMHGKHYYLAPAYPMLFAAGGVAAERLFAARLRWLKPALLSAVIVIGTLLTPIAYTAALPQHFADRFGWKEMARSVARAYHSLPSYDQKRAAIFCQNYGQAGAIDFFGPKYGLPPAISGHQNYFVWGPRDYTGDVVLVLDDRADDEREQFESVEDLGPMESSPWAMPWEQRNHIFLCRNLKGGLKKLWPNLKTWM